MPFNLGNFTPKQPTGEQLAFQNGFTNGPGPGSSAFQDAIGSLLAIKSNPPASQIGLSRTAGFTTEDELNNGTLINEASYTVDLVTSNLNEVRTPTHIHIPIEPTNRANGSYWISYELPTTSRDSILAFFSVKDSEYDIGYQYYTNGITQAYYNALKLWTVGFNKASAGSTGANRSVKFNFFGVTTNRPTEAALFEFNYKWQAKSKTNGSLEALAETANFNNFTNNTATNFGGFSN